jgi:Tfp pilus assembly protein PilX
MTSRSSSRVGGRAQQGVALIVALVMLVIIALMSVSVIRGSLTSDLIANNARSQSLAQQSAELALRYCERQADVEIKAGTTTFILPALADDDGNPANGRPALGHLRQLVRRRVRGGHGA